ncbi:GTP-binding protein [Halopseudomonas sp.]|uniref:CobW family GTP-binding protein n=1 Tax=Halopseudomonas sp. TaxID=2901191 RepID=UPI0035648140
MAIEHIPAHLIAGPLGSGKTTLLGNLLRQRPENERWAILINEFGQIGIDAALLQGDAAGVQLAEIPGGCLCCVNGVPFQVGLARLLRRTRPHRLFIEASGLGHPQELMRQLALAPWQGVLALQPLLMVLDAPRLLAGFSLGAAQQQSLAMAGLVVLNKAENLVPDDCTSLIRQMQPVPALCCSHGALTLAQLPLAPLPDACATAPSLPEGPLPAGEMWRSTSDWHCREQQLDNQRSIGWKMHPAEVFDLAALRAWFNSFPWQRAKAVMHTDQGWLALNGLHGEKTDWQPSDWRRDNRLELIAPDAGMPLRPQLEAALRAAVISSSIPDPRKSS